MTGAAAVRWLDEETFDVDGVTYVCRPMQGRFRSTPERFCLVKPTWKVEAYRRLLDEARPRRLVELGIFEGGGAAMLAQLTDPDLLIAVDLSEERVAALDEFVAARGLEGRVRAHYGVDQASDALGDLVDDALGGASLDLVVDDASHHLDATRRSFEMLFPRLRPGGLYVIEDWITGLRAARFVEDTSPLAILIFELTLAAAHHPGTLPAVTVGRPFVVVERGPDDLALDGFDLGALTTPQGRGLVRGL